ncbi:hypothetical protein DFQ00_10592 [Paenibacillus barcinonensis]|uniref:Uncharacterized protein n=1 Tax=Paenibacillus barcinonensis TaxID=198119 RepID=A0A2V4VSK3_PAEBA|nr:hypothetical protein DFQ00_10592 [Paenibacillus barcinonensis]
MVAPAFRMWLARSVGTAVAFSAKWTYNPVVRICFSLMHMSNVLFVQYAVSPLVLQTHQCNPLLICLCIPTFTLTALIFFIPVYQILLPYRLCGYKCGREADCCPHSHGTTRQQRYAAASISSEFFQLASPDHDPNLSSIVLFFTHDACLIQVRKSTVCSMFLNMRKPRLVRVCSFELLISVVKFWF